jgi:hypothetical protein
MELETGESQLREKVDSIQKRMIIWQVLTTGSLIALSIAVMLLALNKREAVGIDKSLRIGPPKSGKVYRWNRRGNPCRWNDTNGLVEAGN